MKDLGNYLVNLHAGRKQNLTNKSSNILKSENV